MKTQNQTDKATAIDALRNISAALYHAGDKTSSDAINAQLSKLESEHAALVEVAKKAEEIIFHFTKPSHKVYQPLLLTEMRDAIANLAAVREGGAK